MNRRESLQAGLGILSAVSIDGEVSTVSAANPQAFVIKTQKKLPSQEVDRLREQWKQAFVGTLYENTPVIVMQDGMELEVIDQPVQ